MGERVLLFPVDTKPVILTPQGTVLLDDEALLYEQKKPFGFILFKKHCESPGQVTTLCADLRAAVGWHCPVLIDQEGGRVARLAEPHWNRLSPAKLLGDLYRRYPDLGCEATTLQYSIIARMLGSLGIDVNCAPCMDCVPAGKMSDALGDRCFSHDVMEVASLGQDAVIAMIENGVTPIVKHMPGHGRAVEDSHFHLPVVKASENELAVDIKPFRYLSKNLKSVIFWGMTAHIIFTAWDNENPATLSSKIIHDIIRRRIGFDGVLLSDDLAMGALNKYGSLTMRAIQCLDAGIDIALPCHTTMDEAKDLLDHLPVLNEGTRQRLFQWMNVKKDMSHEHDSLDLMFDRLAQILPKQETA